MTDLYDNRRRAETKVLVHFGHRTLNFDSFLLFLLAFVPILQHYKGLLVNPSLGITSFLAIVSLLRLLRHKFKIGAAYLCLLAYGLYAAFVHGVDAMELMRELAQLVVFLAIINGLFDIKKLARYYRVIAICATALIIIQYFCYYILGFHLQLVSVPLLKSSASQWFGLVRTGRIGVTGSRLSFYRPSAFFLEPSHFAVYCIPVVVVALFAHAGDEKRERTVALFVSVGVLLSTSGMGIGIVILSWLIYTILYYGRKGEARTVPLRKRLNKRALALLVVVLGGLAILYFSVPVFRQSVSRIFSTSTESMTAIEGRTSTGRRALAMMQGTQTWIGFGNRYDISDWNMAAFFFVTFKFGWIGTALFYSFYLYSLFHLKREARAMTVAFLILSFFTVHMFGAYYKMYYTMIILYGYVQLRQNSTNHMAMELGRMESS